MMHPLYYNYTLYRLFLKPTLESTFKANGRVCLHSTFAPYFAPYFGAYSSVLRKEMFHLATHSTYLYLCLYDVGYMVKDHSDSERGNRLPHLQGLLFPISSKGSFICTTQQTGKFVTPVVEHWLEREICQWVHHEGSIRRSIATSRFSVVRNLHREEDLSLWHVVTILTTTRGRGRTRQGRHRGAQNRWLNCWWRSRQRYHPYPLLWQ